MYRYICSGNVHASDCGSTIVINGCVVNGISARTTC